MLDRTGRETDLGHAVDRKLLHVLEVMAPVPGKAPALRVEPAIFEIGIDLGVSQVLAQGDGVGQLMLDLVADPPLGLVDIVIGRVAIVDLRRHPVAWVVIGGRAADRGLGVFT